jgi:hypothetical protein
MMFETAAGKGMISDVEVFMKKAILVLMTLVCAQLAHAGDAEEIKECLKKWGNSPFTEKSPFRVVSAKVKVMGIGQDINETNKTSQPELVLIRPAVTVMAKTEMNLENPNGWYCLKGETAVLGKMQINLHCKAHMAASQGTATVLGSDNHEAGTTVLGSTRVARTGNCSDSSKQ